MVRLLLSSIGNLLSILYAKIFLIMVVKKTHMIAKGPHIYVANHPNTLDPFYLLGIMGERVAILITEHVFHIPVLGGLVKRAGHIKVTDSGHEAYKQAKQTLRAGRSILVFAEGDVSYSPNRVKKFHTGAVRLALETNIPIIPIGIHLDTTRIWKHKTLIKHIALVVTWYRYGWYTVVFGEPKVLIGTVSHRLFVKNETTNLRKRVISCMNEAKQIGEKDRMLHKRIVQRGIHTGLRGVYRFVCFVGFVMLKLNDIGVKVLG